MLKFSKIAGLFVALIALFSINLNGNMAYAYQPIDQVNSNYLSGYSLIKGAHWVGQVFTPTKNRMDAIGFRVNGNGATASVNFSLWDLTAMVKLSEKTITIGATESWNYIDFNEDLVISNPNHFHAFYLETDSNTAYWAVTTSDTYSGGYAIIANTARMTNDFAFVTYGYDYSAPPATEAPPLAEEGTAGTEEVSSDGGSAAVTPTGTTSSTIKAPTGLEAIDKPEDNGEAITLSWKASATTDITGYKIYRSAEQTKNFASVGTVKKTELEFNDNSVEINKTYYYYVRAYKSSTESENSNQAEAKSIDNKAPASPANFYIGGKGTKVLNFSWTKNPETDLAGYIFKVYKQGADITASTAQEIKSFELARDRDKFALDFSVDNMLSIDTTYDYYLVAKDNNGNISTPVKAVAKPAEATKTTQSSEEKGVFTQENIIYGAGALLIIALVVFVIVRHKQKKAAKIEIKTNQAPAEPPKDTELK